MSKARVLLFAALHFAAAIAMTAVSVRRWNELVMNQEHPDGTNYETMLAVLNFLEFPLSLVPPSIVDGLSAGVMTIMVVATSLLWGLAVEFAYAGTRRYLQANW